MTGPSHWRRQRPRIVHWMAWPVSIGGAPRLMHSWCRANAAAWDIHVITAGTIGPWDWSGITTWPNVADAAGLFADLRPDLVVNHFPIDPATQTIRCPQVWIMHGMPFLRKPPPAGVRPACVFSNLEAHEIHPAWRKFDWRVLPVGVDLQVFQPRTSPVLRDPPLTLGIVGRLHPEKFPRDPARKLSTSLSAALHGWDPGPWRLKIIGQGRRLEWQDRFRREVADLDWVTFEPDAAPDKMAKVYAGLDALLVPTPPETGETACYSAVEAMACGVPVVARDLPGLRQSCGEAALYGVTDEDLLGAVRLLDHHAARLQYWNAGRRKAKAIHDLRPHLAAHSRAFADALPVEVSILTAVRDTKPEHLAEYWDALRSQTLRAWELVLVDDGSTDPATVKAIDAIAADPRVRLTRLKSSVGGAMARNVGLARCRADLVAIMDSDDAALPGWLASQVPWLRAHPDVTAVGCQVLIFEDRARRELFRTHHPIRVTRRLIDDQRARGRGVWFVNHPGAVYRRQTAIDVGGYGDYRSCHDLSLWLRLLVRGKTIVNVSEVLVHYRQHPGQLTAAMRRGDPQYHADLERVLTEHLGMMPEPEAV